MTRAIRRAGVLAGMLAFAAACGEPPTAPEPVEAVAPAATLEADDARTASLIGKYRIRYPISFALENPCALDGAGEIVKLTGTYRQDTQIVRDGSGRYHIKFRSDILGAMGIGRTTGDMYTVSETYSSSLRYTSEPFATYLTTEKMRVVGQGPGNDFFVFYRVRLTFYPDGTNDHEITLDRAICR